MTRAEHLEWAKKRALEYVEAGRPGEAISSMLSDLGKHEETERSAQIGALIAPLFAPSGNTMSRWSAEVRKWVEGFQ